MRVAMLVVAMGLAVSLSGCIMTAGVSKPVDAPNDASAEQAYEWKGVTIGLGDVSAPGGVKGAGLSIPGAQAVIGTVKAIANAGLSFMGRKQIGGEEPSESAAVAPAVALPDYPAPDVPYAAGLYLMTPVPDPEAE